MSKLDTSPADFLADLFEHELCAECGGDAAHHDAVPLDLGPYGGGWFARCRCPMPDDCESYHPTVAAWRAANGYSATPC